MNPSFGPFIIYRSNSTSSVFSTHGGCRTEGGSRLVLATPLTLIVTEDLSRESLCQSVASAIARHVGTVECVANAQILVQSTIPATQPAASGTRTSVRPSATAVSSVPTWSDKSDSHARDQSIAVRIGTSAISFILGFTAAVAGVPIFIQRRKKARLAEAKAKPEDQESADTSQPPVSQEKPELDVAQQRHEIEVGKERCELEGLSSDRG